MKEDIEAVKNIIYQNSKNGGMCDDINEGQIIGIKTGVELELIATEIVKYLSLITNK